ncbi:DUF5317 domain-containing protein [Bacillus salitolerans]|uniref:DUF5317 domain-containing protein n=1 Tax=Bacillus salitolerans TaxID=1437434 RepID=A0ABW4LRV3_9BACI
MIYEYLFLAILFAYLRAKSFDHLWEVKIKAPYLILSCFVLQLIAMYLYDYSAFTKWFSLFIAASYLLLSIGALINKHLPGFILFSVGMFLNFLVIIINGGRMPVSSKALEAANLSHYIEILESGYRKHQLINEHTMLPFLGDVIPLHLPYALFDKVISIGDVIITFGMCIFFFYTITGIKSYVDIFHKNKKGLEID